MLLYIIEMDYRPLLERLLGPFIYYTYLKIVMVTIRFLCSRYFSHFNNSELNFLGPSITPLEITLHKNSNQFESLNSDVICERYEENNYNDTFCMQKIWTRVTYASDPRTVCDTCVRHGDAGALCIRVF